MQHKEFVQKYNDFKINKLPNYDHNLDFLKSLYSYLFDISMKEIDFRKNENIQHSVDVIIHQLRHTECTNLYQKAIKICLGASLITLYQPFYDGNTRISALFMKAMFQINNIHFTYRMNEQDPEEYKQLMDLLYDPSDSISDKTKKKLIQYIQN